MSEKYFPPVGGARWTCGRFIEDRWVNLIQDTPCRRREVFSALRALEIESTPENIERYFPIRRRRWPVYERGHCPTLELLEMFSTLNRKGNGGVGV